MNIYGVSWYLRMFLFFPILSFGMNVGGWSLSDPFPAIWNESHWDQWEEFSIMILPKCGDGNSMYRIVWQRRYYILAVVALYQLQVS